ncbi:phosphoribosyltransferase [Paenibacillus aceris]|uniref:Hypoxanthine phosphoribosyltransferase n=1 Tax=Paenibacillus aceris TaxID=869555 RepID=A0ABS4IAD3_9BACL|nr:phosphoribosyltransferase [Paenibacillus aceris]MBP1967029.1 hypoxanthine phosphoribosyltransferase [Paenibacillus aceris]NHW33226.1 phosphoribosyltransferase [Paenibacillus aceris]
MSQEVREQKYDALVIIMRGGALAGTQMAFLTGLPYYFLNYNRSLNIPVWFHEPQKSERILLIEDFAGSGRTVIIANNS